jgi:hypothetical protein
MFYTCSTLIIISVSYFYSRLYTFTTRVYIRLQPIPITLIILAIETLSFNIVSALIRVLIKYSLWIGVLVLEADTLEALLLKRTERGAEGASSSESESDSEGILYYLSSSSSSSSSKRLIKESTGSNLLLDNPKSGKLNKI